VFKEVWTWLKFSLIHDARIPCEDPTEYYQCLYEAVQNKGRELCLCDPTNADIYKCLTIFCLYTLYETQDATRTESARKKTNEGPLHQIQTNYDCYQELKNFIAQESAPKK
jgi:hypothetical protein